MLSTTKYATGFSSGALLLKEADALVYQIDDAEEFMHGNLSLNYTVIPVNSESSKKRLGIEVVKRLRNTQNPIFIEFYKTGTLQDKQLILFYAACKTYALIVDFMLEIVLNKWYNLDFELSSNDFQNYIYRIMGNYTELENLTPYTIKKLSHVVLKMLNQIGIVHEYKLHKVEFNGQILKTIAHQGDIWFLELLFLSKQERNELTD
ncbi:MAG: DUF1819 family protein [Spirosomaceae bacterium]|jgi:hypothetical protein|nr:DUF1819 family protein [Spirosomataceae bacterium]